MWNNFMNRFPHNDVIPALYPVHSHSRSFNRIYFSNEKTLIRTFRKLL